MAQCFDEPASLQARPCQCSVQACDFPWPRIWADAAEAWKMRKTTAWRDTMIPWKYSTRTGKRLIGIVFHQACSKARPPRIRIQSWKYLQRRKRPWVLCKKGATILHSCSRTRSCPGTIHSRSLYDVGEAAFNETIDWRGTGIIRLSHKTTLQLEAWL